MRMKIDPTFLQKKKEQKLFKIELIRKKVEVYNYQTQSIQSDITCMNESLMRLSVVKSIDISEIIEAMKSKLYSLTSEKISLETKIHRQNKKIAELQAQIEQLSSQLFLVKDVAIPHPTNNGQQSSLNGEDKDEYPSPNSRNNPAVPEKLHLVEDPDETDEEVHTPREQSYQYQDLSLPTWKPPAFKELDSLLLSENSQISQDVRNQRKLPQNPPILSTSDFSHLNSIDASSMVEKLSVASYQAHARTPVQSTPLTTSASQHPYPYTPPTYTLEEKTKILSLSSYVSTDKSPRLSYDLHTGIPVLVPFGITIYHTNNSPNQKKYFAKHGDETILQVFAYYAIRKRQLLHDDMSGKPVDMSTVKQVHFKNQQLYRPPYAVDLIDGTCNVPVITRTNFFLKRKNHPNKRQRTETHSSSTDPRNVASESSRTIATSLQADFPSTTNRNGFFQQAANERLPTRAIEPIPAISGGQQTESIQ